MSFDALEQTHKELGQNPEITERNKEIINEFIQHLRSEGVKSARIVRYLSSFNALAPHINWALDNPGEKNIKALVGKINSDNIEPLRESTDTYSEHSKIELRKTIRKFYQGYLGEEELIEWLNVNPNSHNPKVDPEELPRPQHIKDLVEETEMLRDKALIMTLWDTGARIGGLVKTQHNQAEQILRWKDIKFKDEYAAITIRDKSWASRGEERTIPIREALPFLKKLYNEREPELDDPVFQMIKKDEPLTAQAVRQKLKRLEKKVDLPPRVKTNPHAFRKARATFKASIGWNQAQLCQYFGWVQGSKEAAKYIRLAEQDLEKALLKEYGEEPSEELQEDLLKPVRCRECHRFNFSEWGYCRGCGEEIDFAGYEMTHNKDMELEKEKWKKDKVMEFLSRNSSLSEQEIDERLEQDLEEKFGEDE